MGLIERKRHVLMSLPHKEHSPVGDDFDVTIAEPKIQGMNLYFDVIQEGSGTPNVNNKRGFKEWFSVSATIGNKTYEKSWNGLYGRLKGYYECDTGILHFQCRGQEVTGDANITSYSDRGSSSIFWGYFSALAIYNSTDTPLSNMFTFTGYNYNYNSVPDWSFGGSSTYPNSAWFKVPNTELSELSLDGAKQWVTANNIVVYAPRKAGDYLSDIGVLSVKADRGLQHVTTPTGVTTEFDYWTNRPLVVREPYLIGDDILADAVWIDKRLISSDTGEMTNVNGYASFEEYIPINPSYSFKANVRLFVFYYRADKSYIERQVIQANGSTSIPQDSAFVRVSIGSGTIGTATIIRTA